MPSISGTFNTADASWHRTAAAQTRRKCPSLPVEIWLRIFSLATLVPGALDTDDYGAIQAFCRDHHGISQHNRYDAVMDVKRSISLVCRSWHALISTTNLYEYVLIRNGHQAIQVANLLKEDRDEHSQLAPPRASRIMRLELALEGVHLWTREHAMALNKIIQLCTNLVCFSTVFSTADAFYFYSPQLIRVLADTATRKTKIQRLELKADRPILSAIIGALELSLEVLWIQIPRRLTCVPSPWTPNLPNLTTFVSSLSLGGLFKDAAMPALRNLSTSDAVDRAGILHRHGPALSQLALPNLANLKEHVMSCPNLACLDITYDVPIAGTLLPFGIPFPSLVQVTLDAPFIFRRTLWAGDDGTAPLYLDNLRSVLLTLVDPAVFPALHTLRFILPLRLTLREPEDSDASLPGWTLTFWQAWLNACMRRGIKIQITVGARGVFSQKWANLTLDLVEYLM
ncbi:hypothetical protein HGRIS_012894 [Hohenbuehelia grisea]|uniref:F-box domain-containing protein n=1 Tax=Hohenbuehelia grisea TaxID=104357 RepID=A0ABR3ITR6_9AGAR